MLYITPNNRLSAFLKSNYLKYQENLPYAAKIWASPTVLTLESWFEKLWQQSLKAGCCPLQKKITLFESSLIWERIIRNTSAGQNLYFTDATVEKVMQAWQFLHQCQLPIEQLQAYQSMNVDVAAFLTWQTAYQSELEEHDWIDMPLIVETLLNLNNYEHLGSQQVLLVECDALPPQYMMLIERLKSVFVFSPLSLSIAVPQPPTQSIVKAKDFEDELQLMLGWIQRVRRESPGETIGVVCLDLEVKRQQIVDAIDKVLPPKTYNISAPQSMAQYPLIETYLSILSLSEHQVNLDNLSFIITNPFLKGFEKEVGARFAFDLFLRQQNEPKFYWASIKQLLEQFCSQSEQDLSCLLEIIQTFLTFKNNAISKTGTTIQFASRMQAILDIFIATELFQKDEAILQLQVCWGLLLDQFVALEAVLPKLTYSEALIQLQKLAYKTPFLPESGQVHCHILGVLEATGLVFDHLWIMGLHMEAWPPAPKPNPFIPLSLQKAYDCPRSSSERELKIATRLTQSFITHTRRHLIASYPGSDEDKLYQESALIKTFKPIVLSRFYQDKLTLLPHEMEYIYDHQGPSFQGYLEGGIEPFKLQNLCPFKSFARFRLKANPLPKLTEGITPLERGDLIHTILAIFWREYHHQQQLNAIQDISTVIRPIVITVLHKKFQSLSFRVQARDIELEIQIITQILSQWLLLEKQRIPFTVKAIEMPLSININGLSCRVRIDRIDELDIDKEKALIIIDYKTGKVNQSDWFGERPRDIQLPIYGQVLNELPVALAYAVIRTDEIKFQGVAKQDGILPNVGPVIKIDNYSVETAWQEQCQLWDEVVTQTARAILSGDAKVNPRDKNVCGKCHLTSLCRIHEVEDGY